MFLHVGFMWAVKVLFVTGVKKVGELKRKKKGGRVERLRQTPTGTDQAKGT